MSESSIQTAVYPCHGGYTGEVRVGGRLELARICKTRDEAATDVHEIKEWIERGRPRDSWWFARL